MVAAVAAVAAAAAWVGARLPRRVAALAVVVLLADAAWVGANTTSHGWFGDLVSHGPRTGNEVALTFDDGPNSTATLAIARTLDAYGAKGTFFSVGKAVERRPDIVQALYADGHLVANHSFNHDSRGWLNPVYPELARTQEAVQRATGACPAFYRAPHGQHTPFLARVVHRRHMKMAGWDVSVGDWKPRAPEVIARMVLKRVRAGSIVDLHDGLDGKVDVDRTELVEAMPLILDGLRAKGLRPVRLDVLLKTRGYLPACAPARRPPASS